MHLEPLFSPLPDVKADWLILGHWEGEALPRAVAEIDAHLGGIIAQLREPKDIEGKPLELTPLWSVKGVACERILLVGMGKRTEAKRATLIDSAAAAARSLTGKKRGRLAFALPEEVPNLGWDDVAWAVSVGAMQGSYGPGLFKSEPSRFEPESVALVAPPSAPQAEVRRGVTRADAEGRAVRLARELVNLPPCDLYPQAFAERAQRAAAELNVACEVMDEEALKKEQMGALLGVARGSVRPARLVVLRYQAGGNRPTLGLVGKGVTFDSGGLSLKTTDQMADMKCDMAGAAAVLGGVLACAELKVPVNLLGVMALVENMPSGNAVKLGDVLRTRAGKTIEVLNTDAEGRLILADALSYAVDQKVSHLVDLATLTGACMIALGTDVAGVMGNNDAWVKQVLEASARAGEMAWQLPMSPHFGELIKSQVADMKNTGGTRYGGAITAAKLLERFVGDVPWAHLDIAGPAWAEHESATHDTGGTGCFVRTLVELARAYATGEPVA
jgi:leucyl aminopeptidase